MSTDNLAETLQSLLNKFCSVSLSSLNERAALLKRLERKYVLDELNLALLLEKFLEHHLILDIDGRRVHRYLSTYYDTSDMLCFRAHNQGRHNRFKLRIRRYEDSGQEFFELKEKTRLSATAKSRVPVSDDVLSGPDFGGLLSKVQSIAGLGNDLKLSPVLTVRYGRVTFFDPRDLTRVTVDMGLSFKTCANSPVHILVPKVIVEVKSARRRSLTDRLLREMDLRVQKRMSKYCIGVTVCGLWLGSSRFSSLTRRLLKSNPQLKMVLPTQAVEA